jgi:predicted transglutaminase-like cysteine proteinase
VSSGESKFFKRSAAASAVALALLGCPTASIAQERPLFISTGQTARAPSGWIEFCIEYDPECKTSPSSPRDAVLSDQALKDLERVNRWVNTNITRTTDMEHWGLVERWNYPDDGYGDCEDYVLLKRRMLMQAGWPREALLITVVRDAYGNGHAILTVKTDKGEFILDNQTDDILLWSDTSYRFVERQSQADPNVWVSLDNPGEPTTVVGAAITIRPVGDALTTKKVTPIPRTTLVSEWQDWQYCLAPSHAEHKIYLSAPIPASGIELGADAAFDRMLNKAGIPHDEVQCPKAPNKRTLLFRQRYAIRLNEEIGNATITLNWKPNVD